MTEKQLSPIPTAAEMQYAVSELESTRDALLDTCATLPQNAWTLSDGEARWTAAQVLEHITIVERRVVGLLEKMLGQPPEPDWHDRTASKDAILPHTRVANEKLTAPPPLHPTGQQTPAELIAAFQSARAATLAFAARPHQPLKEHTQKHLALGELNGYQWLVLAAHHTTRHLAQIKRCAQPPHAPTTA
ncbi:MAG TPA: DinB family protein [Terriglobales bacterium]|nr:DinB family protein [Terriglobales bacterium]